MSKRITFIINNFWIGGTERLVYDIVFGLKDANDVSVVTVLGCGELESGFKKVGSIYNAGFNFLNSRKFLFKLVWILIAPIVLIRTILVLKKIKPDIVVTSLYQADIIGMLAAQICGIKKRVLIQHDIQRFSWLRKKVKLWFALRFATGIVANSNTTKNFIVSYWGVEPSKIKVIPNGVDVEKFERGINLNPDYNEPVLGIVGRLEPVKGHKYLLEALKVLKEKGIEPKIMIAGDGSLRDELEEYKKDNSLDKVEFIGLVDDVPNFLKSIDILVVPSIEEGFGSVALEGLIARKIVVASDIGAFKEFIKDGENGILFEVGDGKNLANKLYSVISNPHIMYKYCKRIDSWARNNSELYNTRTMVGEYVNILNL